MNGRTRRLRLAMLLVPAVAAWAGCAERPAPASEQTRVFEGAWFDVAYPASFEPRPSLESTTAEGYDSVFFDAPDGTARFYVYSPQWGGDATDIAVDTDTEEVVDSVTTTDGPIATTRVTIAARDGSWTRSYVTTSDERGPTRWTIGWGWSSEEARDRYAAAFAAFRASLEQFSD